MMYLRYIWITFILVGLIILIYQYFVEQSLFTKANIPKCPPPTNELNYSSNNYKLDKGYKNMFNNPSVWDTYDYSSINKIYKENDISNLNVST